MCQCQKEMSRPLRITIVVFILGLGGLMIGYIAMYHDDLFQPFREHRIKLRMEALKVDGYTSIGPSISWQSLEGHDIPSPPPEPPSFPLPPAK